MGYKVLAPCTVRAADSKSATHYRQVGEVVDVPHADDAKQLVADGFLEKVKDDEPEAEESKPDKSGGGKAKASS